MIVEARGLLFAYPKGRRALDGVEFTVGSGARLAVIGPNGSGKSTLFHILATLLPPGAGVVKIGGYDVGSGAAEIRRHTGVVFQGHAMDRRMTVRENLACFGALRGMPAAAVEARARVLLDQFELSARRDDLAGSLSGGLLRRLDLATALLGEPRLLLLDEASAGLDASARRSFWEAVEDYRRRSGATVIYTTHLLEEIEDATRVLFLRNGRAVALDTPTALMARAGEPVIEIAGVGLDTLMQARGAQRAGDAWRLRHPEPAAALLEISRTPGVRIDHAAISRPALEQLFEEAAHE